MSELEELETSIQTSLATIRAHWAALLAVALPGAASLGQRGATNSTRGVPSHDPELDPLGVMVADDHLDSDADIDRTTRVISLRREVLDVLNAVSRWVMEERPITRALPDGTSVLSMSLFLDRHAQWIAGRDMEDNSYETNRLAALATKVRQLAAPRKREFIYLGDCPFVIEDWFCRGRVRVRIGDEEGEASCSDCHQVGPVDWWETVLGIAATGEVTIPALVPILRDRMHVTVTERTLQRWHRAGRITATGGTPGVPTFDPRVTLDQVAHMDRECSSCGVIRSGFGDMCLDCWKKQHDAKPTWAPARKATPAAIRLFPPRVVPDSHDTDRPARCHYSDLPVDQCACGHEHQESA